jgi:hypothetical protein
MTARCPLNSQCSPLHPLPVNSYLVIKPEWKCGGAAMQFTRVVSNVDDMEAWNASSNGFSFVISYEDHSCRGFHGRTGFVASWRPIDQNRSANRVGGSPFKTLGEAEGACNAMVGLLTKGGPMEAHVNFDAKAVLRKWPSLRNERRNDGTGPYLLVDGTLDECIRAFLAKPNSSRHLYEIHTATRPPLVDAVLPLDLILELATAPARTLQAFR